MLSQASVHGDRLLFAQYLRGPAAVLVVISHALGVFWAKEDNVARLIGVAPLKDDTDFALALPEPVMSFVGQVGVSTFFMISGFVIALSVTRTGRGAFLVRRLLRIYPVYIVCFAVTVLAIWLTGAAFGGEFPYTAGQLLVHALILPREWIGSRMIDGVSWTLEIELTFYLLMTLFGRTLLRAGLIGLTTASLCCAAIGLGLTIPAGWDWIARQFATLPMLFAGAGFYLHHQGRMPGIEVVALTLAGLASSSLAMAFSDRFNVVWIEWNLGYVGGIAAFAAAYWLRDRIRASPLLNHLALISYPLYASHIFICYTLLYSTLRLQLPPAAGLAAVCFATWAIALVIHLAVERPALALAKRF